MMASFLLSLETAFLASAIISFILLIALVYIKLFSVKINGLSYWIFAYICQLLKYGVLDGVKCINYAFDATSFDLIIKIITQDGVFSPEEQIQRYK